ncbi:acyltransferase [Paraneptunicella aestuarii]|uniref:acyltransferase family protein n=1 Tax=Paraneptunicella aestuarii TaxID=2831148 RepID=UPI001E293D12|nr:acyltransferase family protein [Paraneptunicella aestuarii]UAA39151.1 acyltransferase [Paraneptunicella aestuarii]
MQYRPEIDGLRAVSVIPVILFHAGFPFISGGFIGVDIFFVISGYLITSIIANDVERNTFRLTDFYERRVRRILPALFFIMAVTVPLAWMWLPPDELKNYSQSLVAVSTFSSNILFWLESGYFDTVAELKPLLHTWSLAVEEQYYIVFPLIIMALWKLSSRLFFVMLAATFCLSLGYAHLYSSQFLSSSFYLLPFRAWELLMGALAAFMLRNKSHIKLPGSANELLSMLGIVCIVGSFFLFEASTPSPSLYTLIPTLGALVVILFTTPETRVSRLLSSKVFVLIGLISYSAYLWHQPLFVFARSYSLEPLSLALMLAMCLLSLVLAFVTWKWIETPFRSKEKIKASVLYIVCSVFVFLFIAMGLYGHFKVKPTTEIQLDSEIIAIPKAFMGIQHEGRNCSFPDIAKGEVCELKGDIDAPERTVFVLGDSLSRVLSEAVYERKQMYSTMVDLSSSGCPFLMGLSIYVGRSSSDRCTPEYQQQRLDYIAQHPSQHKIVVLSGRWLVAFMEDSFDNTLGGVSYDQNIVATKRLGASDEEIQQDFFESFERSLAALTDVVEQVVIIIPGYSNGWDPVARAVRIAKRFDDSQSLFEHLEIPLSAVDNRTAVFEQYIQSHIQGLDKVSVINTKDVTCDRNKGVCYGGKDGQFYFTDDLHPSLYINRILVELMYKALVN